MEKEVLLNNYFKIFRLQFEAKLVIIHIYTVG